MIPVVGVLTGAFPSLDLLGVETLGATKFGEFRVVHGGGLEDGVEFVGGAPPVRGVVAGGHEDALFAGLTTPSVEGGQADGLLFGKFWK